MKLMTLNRLTNEISIEEALVFINQILREEVGVGLDATTKGICIGIWNNEDYDSIAAEIGLSPSGVKQAASKRIFAGLNKAGIFPEKISKKSFVNLISEVVRIKKFDDKLTNKESTFESDEIGSEQQKPRDNINIEKIVNNPLTTSLSETLAIPKGGILALSPLYIYRGSIEEEARKEIERPRSLLKIEGAKQTGKTSLLNQLLKYAESEYQTIYIDFHLIDRNILKSEDNNLEKLLKWFLANIAVSLNLKENINRKWSPMLGAKGSCTNYLKTEILEQIDRPLVLALDKVDYLFGNLEIALDFFGLLRGWYETSGQNDETWRKLKLVLVYCENRLEQSADQSPFNVGTTIKLDDFTFSEIKQLIGKYKLDLKENEIKTIVSKVGQNPYSIHNFLGNFAKQNQTLEAFFAARSFLSPETDR